MWTSGDHHPGAVHDLPGHFQPSWLSPEDVAAAVPDGGPRPLIGGTILEETLWSCTTCGACMDQCPVLIEHVPKIMDMRRHLVLDELRMPKQAESALRNIENVANPYGLSHQSRADWAKDLGIVVHRRQARRRVPVLGRLRGIVRRAREDDRRRAVEDPPGGRGGLRHPRHRGEVHRRSRAAGSATSTSSRSARRRTSRCSRSTTCARSSRRARTASTRSPTSTRISAATTR